MGDGVGGAVAVYEAVAVVYNDATHWWADLKSSGHFRHRKGADGISRPLGAASYRYDGLEAEGQLRFCGHELTLTSDPRHISVVLYRRAARTSCRPAGARQRG